MTSSPIPAVLAIPPSWSPALVETLRSDWTPLRDTGKSHHCFCVLPGSVPAPLASNSCPLHPNLPCVLWHMVGITTRSGCDLCTITSCLVLSRYRSGRYFYGQHSCVQSGEAKAGYYAALLFPGCYENGLFPNLLRSRWWCARCCSYKPLEGGI